ncbi:MAG: bifunctional hydroxymethylpyrimidine kinase/phosphomethylpyrimidine kinase [Alistipes sp.]|nr:bifunctional hydroxymethylpyrimidine kinase/phosphomethylpyrimidine kinase [Alistipes sp.]
MILNDNNNEVKFPSCATRKRYRVALSIAGSDSSGGAGIQADIKTFSSLGIYGASVVTAITAQNTLGVHSVFPLPYDVVYDQIMAVMEDLHPSVVKIGMLANVDIVRAVAEALSRYDVPIVLDPVVVSTSGHRLLSVEALDEMKRLLLPMASVVTPNIPEMEALTTMPLATDLEKLEAARYLMSMSARAVLLKGGHEPGAVKRDILYRLSNDGIAQEHISMPTVPTRNTHGTGCTLSSAIAAYMAVGCGLSEAVRQAKEYVTKALAAGADVVLGEGHGPVNHLFNPEKMRVYEK